MYEVYALKYGERDTTMCQFFYREHRHEPLTLHYFVWLIMGGPHPVLVDTGFRDDDAQARGIKNYVSPAEVVERFGVGASDVPLCLISHLHYDHWAGHTLFPKAQFWIQKDEVAFWTGRHAGTPAFRGSANVPSLANLVVSNVPGPPMTLFMAGAKIVHYYPVSIVTHGLGLNITVNSYAGWLEFGVIAGKEIVPKVATIATGLNRALNALSKKLH